MKSFYKGLRRFLAVLIGLVFFVAGTLKLMDPVGTGLIVAEYLRFMHLGFLAGASKILGVLLALTETIVGAALVSGVWRQFFGIVSGFMLGFFTLLTFFLWILNPPMDCGCFGEAIHLTHSQSLAKNIVMLAMWMVAFIPFSKLGKPRRLSQISFWTATASTLLFTLYSVLSIPAIDFTDYAPGAELYAAVGLEEDDPQMEVSENLAVPLSFSDAAGEYCDHLACEGSVCVLSVYDPGRLGGEDWQKISDYLDSVSEYGCKPLLLVASTPEEIEAAAPGPVLMRCYYADRKTLLTLNRSNGGVTFIGDGQIVAKWAFRSLPDSDALSRLVSSNPTESMMRYSTRSRTRMQAYMLYVTAVLLLL